MKRKLMRVLSVILALVLFMMDPGMLTVSSQIVDLVISKDIDSEKLEIPIAVDEMGEYKRLEVLLERGSVSTTYDLGYSSNHYKNYVRSAFDIKTGGATRLSIEKFNVTHGTMYVQFFASDYTKISSVIYTDGAVVNIPSGCEFIRVEIATSAELEKIAIRFYNCSDNPSEAKRSGINEISEKLTYKVSDDIHTTSRLMLPPNYSTDGEKVPVILWLEGSGSSLSSWNGDFNSNKLPYLQYLRDEGFAVFSVYAWGNEYAEKYPKCGNSFPYPIPINLACIKEGIEYICSRYNLDTDNLHIMSKSQGGQVSLYYASCNELNVKSIGMFAPVLDYLSMPGEAMYKDTRAAIAEELGFTGDVEYFASDRFLSYSEEGRAFLRENLDKLKILNEAWTNLTGAELEELFESSMNDCETFWTEQIWKTDRTDIYTHTEYVKTATVPVKIWGAADDAATPYLKMVEVVAQLKNGGSVAELVTLPNGTGGHSCADVGSTRVDVTTALGIEHKNVPIGWVENIEWIRLHNSTAEDDIPNYEGKTIACVGDSITYAYGVTKDETDYVTLLAKKLGMNYIRLGQSGTTLCTDGSRTCNINKLTERNLNGADVVTIAMGINDFCAAGTGYYELGNIQSTDTSTIYGAMKMWCERIEELRKTDSLKNTEFYFLTPVITSWNNSVTSARNWDQSKKNIHGYTLRDLCNAIIEVATLYDVDVIDLNLLSGMYYVSAEDNNTAIFGGDGVHPGEVGHEMMANALANVLLKNDLKNDHDHTFGSWITTTWSSDCKGEQKRVCTICCAMESRDTNHNYTAVVTDPTCTEQGYTTYACHCGDSYISDRVDALGHNYSNHVCTRCGEILRTMNLFYDDHVNVAGKAVEIIDASQSAIVELKDNYLVAVGIGTAKVRIDGETYEITINKAKVNLIMIMGQSNAGNHFPNATSDVTCPIGTAYWWGDGKGTSATEPVPYIQPSMGFHAPLLAELYAQSVAAGAPVKNVLIWQEGITSKNGQSIMKWAASASDTSGTDGAVTMLENCRAYYLANSDKFEIVRSGVYWLQGESDLTMDPVLYTQRFMAIWQRLKTAGMEYVAFLRVRRATNTNSPISDDLFYSASLAAQLKMINENPEFYLATDVTENWIGKPTDEITLDISKYITMMEAYGQSATYTDAYGNIATFADGKLTTSMKSVYGSNNTCHYGKFGYGVIGADAAYNMYCALHAQNAEIVVTDTSGYADRKIIFAHDEIITLDISSMTDNLAFRVSCGSTTGTLNFIIRSGDKDITSRNGIIFTSGEHYGCVNVEVLRDYDDVSIELIYTATNGTVYTAICEIPNSPREPKSDYIWDFNEDLYARDDKGEIHNSLLAEILKGSYTLQDGYLIGNGLQMALEKAIELEADKNWSVEWRYGVLNGSTAGFLLCSNKGNTVGNKAIWHTKNGNLIIADYVDGKGYRNYTSTDVIIKDYDCLKLTNSYDPITKKSTISLYLNGELVIEDIGLKGSINDYHDRLDMTQYPLNADFSFNYLGNPGMAEFLMNCQLDYLKISFGEAHTHSYTTAVTAPTCTEQGYTTYTCECGNTYIDDYVPASGHAMGEWYETKAPTCTEEGEQRRDCVNCDHFEIEVIEANGHKYQTGICGVCGVKADPYLQQLPENILGCSNLYDLLIPTKGYYTATKYDTSNGSVLSVVIPVEPGDRITASSFGPKSQNMGSVNGIRVTYLLDGVIVLSLSASDVYNAYMRDGYITVPEGVNMVCIPWWKPDNGNTLTLAQTSKDYAIHSPAFVPEQTPTCTENGYTAGEICEICHISLSIRTEIPATGHSYRENFCIVCGALDLKAILNGKYVSILGDSISTFDGYSNNATVNTTLGGNAPRYKSGTADTKPGSYCLLDSVNDTWWMQFANQTGMNLLVNNSWAGSQVFGGKTSDGRVIPAAYLERCINLHDNTLANNPNLASINPDIIFVYLGINDYNFNRDHVGNGEIDYAKLILEDGTYATPTTFGEAYAIMLHKMKQAYPNAQIFAMTLLPENLYSVDMIAWEQHNAYIRAAAENYDIPVVDLAANCAIAWDNYSEYVMDKIHPTTKGMKLISDCIEAELSAYYKENPPHVHTPVFDEAVKATCIKSGLTEGSHCETCGEVLVAQNEIPALGHTYDSVVTAPTCTEQGYTTYTCHCGDTYVNDYVPANGHAMGKWYETKASTCTEEGEQRSDCENCDHFETEVLAANGHNYDSVVTAPTCTEQGYTTYTCHCGDTYVDNYTEVTDHSYTEGTCSICGIRQTSIFLILDTRCNQIEIFTYEVGMTWKEWLNSKYNTGMGSCIAIWVSAGPDILGINPYMDIFVNGEIADYDSVILEEDVLTLVRYN